MRYRKIFSSWLRLSQKGFIWKVWLFLMYVGLSADQGLPEIRWLGGESPPVRSGITMGIPWPQGQFVDIPELSIVGNAGASSRVQTWPLAYWPDGSLKWTGHAFTVGDDCDEVKLVEGVVSGQRDELRVEVERDYIRVVNNDFVYKFGKQGRELIRSIYVDEVQVCSGVGLISKVGDLFEASDATGYESSIVDAVVEQDGPVRAVIRLQGVHKRISEENGELLPFDVRFYLYAGIPQIRIVHSVIYNGDPHKESVSGLGLKVDIPLREEMHNRHVRFSGEGLGVFSEPIRLLRGRRLPGEELYRQQLLGAELPPLVDLPLHENIKKMAKWDGFRLLQLAPNSFSIEKQTGDQSPWVRAVRGVSSGGVGFAGDSGGGIALGLANFSEKYPSAIEIKGMTSMVGSMYVWLWPPYAQPMDLRHYSDSDHGLEASYEDIEDGFSTPYGIANTNELYLFPFSRTPAPEEFSRVSQLVSDPPLTVCSPEYYHSIPVFGVWSLPDRSNPHTELIEDRLNAGLDFYKNQVAQHGWYGFWDFGDFMHSYDEYRHSWMYDVGGFAWANTELMPDLWLWYSFLRTGRADVFRMAEAMTRHTQEVDVYHMGPFRGLGSRHNVTHWGCSAKEVRISQALLKRPFYYLTADERTGDLMNDVVDAQEALLRVPPLRKVWEQSESPVDIRIGPDWFALVSNWFAAWERTGDVVYRDRIIAGMKSIVEMEHGLFSGIAYGFDPVTFALERQDQRIRIPTLATLMGGPELMMELTPLIDYEPWTQVWLEYCRNLSLPPDQQDGRLGVSFRQNTAWYSRVGAWAAWYAEDEDLARRAWRQLLDERVRVPLYEIERINDYRAPVEVYEAQQISTNDAAQWALNAIQILELISNYIE